MRTEQEIKDDIVEAVMRVAPNTYASRSLVNQFAKELEALRKPKGLFPPDITKQGYHFLVNEDDYIFPAYWSHITQNWQSCGERSISAEVAWTRLWRYHSVCEPPKPKLTDDQLLVLINKDIKSRDNLSDSKRYYPITWSIADKLRKF